MSGAEPVRTALVTGGSGGIGLAVVEQLLELGYALTISGRRPEKLEATTAMLRERGAEVQGVAAPADDERELIDLVAAHRERYDRLDVLVNNAGVGIASRPDAVRTKHVDLQIGVNMRALVLLTREALPLLRAAGREHGEALIVNMASIAGEDADPELAVYSATKAAVVSYSEATLKSVEREGIAVTAICPGFVDTDMTEFVRDRVDAADMLRPSDVAETVRFLLRTSRNCRVPTVTLMRPAEVHGLGI